MLPDTSHDGNKHNRYLISSILECCTKKGGAWHRLLDNAGIASEVGTQWASVPNMCVGACLLMNILC